MEADFVTRLNAQSTLAELPSFDVSIEPSARGELLGETLDRDPRLPGVVVTEGGAIRGVISRGQYLRLVGRHLGREVYHPRPIELMLEALGGHEEEPLVLPRDTPIQEAVRHALERPRELIYEPIVLRGQGELGRPPSLRLVDFPDLLRADSRISSLRNRQMDEILSTVQEGFLLVDPDHRIASEHSRYLETLFETPDVAGRPFPELIADYLGEEKAELGRGYLDTLFNPNVIERLVGQINPLMQAAALMPEDGRTKHLAFRFHRSVEAGTIRRVLVRIEDVTREVEMAAELEERERRSRERMELVFDILRADTDQLTGFLADFDRQLERSGELLSRNGDGPPVAERLETLFRAVHALKGEAGMLELATFQRRIHRFEDALAELRDSPDRGQLGSLAAGLEPLRRLADDTREVIERFRELGGAVAKGNGAAGAPRPPAPGLYDGLSGLVRELSERLGKPARFLPRNPEEEIPEKYRKLLREALVQLARNAVVHGLEPPEERRRRGKPPVGTLQLALRRHDRQRRLELVFQDDGAGLDLDELRRVAADRGVTVNGDERPEMLIFRSGLSTAGETTLDAGRGVGMDVVRARIEEAGGTILPHSQPGVYCAFQILLPL